MHLWKSKHGCDEEPAGMFAESTGIISGTKHDRLMVWMFPAAVRQRLVIILMTRHCAGDTATIVVGSVEIPLYLVVRVRCTGAISSGPSLLPTLAGNITGEHLYLRVNGVMHRFVTTWELA